jgi:hypothetical protein
LVEGASSAPTSSELPVTVAACPPLVLSVTVELLNDVLELRSSETGPETADCQY